MGHNSVVPGYPKCIGIMLVNELLTGSLDLGCRIFGCISPPHVLIFIFRVLDIV